MSWLAAVGTRTLIAKTCPACGELKMSDQFYRWQKQWSYRCKSCQISYVSSRRRPGATTRDHHRWQEESGPGATKKYERYTSADWDILIRDDLTLREKAKMLNRSFAGVRAACRRYRRSQA